MTAPLEYRPSHSAVHYTPPGSFEPGRTIVGFVIAAIAVAIASIIYAKIQPHLDTLYLRAGACVCAGIALGVLALIPVRIGHIRTPAPATVCGTLLGLIALYFMWLTLLHDVFRPLSYRALVMHPMLDVRLIQFVNRTGTWRMQLDARNVAGPLLLVFWIGEALIIVGGGVAIPINVLYSGDPVCKECGSRCKRVPNLPRFAVDRQVEFLEIMDRRDFDKITPFPAARSSDDPELSPRLMSCPKCRTMNVLTVNRIAWGRDSRGRRKVLTTPLIDQILISSTEAEELKSVCGIIRQLRDAAANPPNVTA
jgi:hypothetical protein